MQNLNNLIRSTVAVSAVAFGLVVGSPANATLIIKANGTTVATDTTNTFATYTGAIGGFNINSISVAGVNAFGGSGELIDVSSLNIATAGSGSLTILVTETDLLGSANPMSFNTSFTALLTNINISRSFFLDTTNQGIEGILLGSAIGGGGSFTSTPFNVFGPFALVERIEITALGRGAKLSADDSVLVPEPASLGLLGLGLLAVGFVRRRKAA